MPHREQIGGGAMHLRFLRTTQRTADRAATSSLPGLLSPRLPSRARSCLACQAYPSSPRRQPEPLPSVPPPRPFSTAQTRTRCLPTRTTSSSTPPASRGREAVGKATGVQEEKSSPSSRSRPETRCKPRSQARSGWHRERRGILRRRPERYQWNRRWRGEWRSGWCEYGPRLEFLAAGGRRRRGRRRG